MNNVLVFVIYLHHQTVYTLTNMKAIALIRVSTINQDLSQQTDTVINEMIKDGYSKDNIILIEDKESAVKLDEEQRLGLNRLKSEILADSSINAVYIFELSRLSRRPEILYSIRDFLINHHIQLVVLKPYMKLLDTDGKLSQTASIMFGIFGALAEQEGYLRKERMQRGVLAKKAQGKYAGGHLPFGYAVDPKTRDIIVDEEQANIVRRMFKMYVEDGMSTVQIAKHFNETGELKVCDGSSTVDTAVTTIRYMLLNKAYVGGDVDNRYTNQRVRNIYPRIVSDKLFDAASQMIQSGKKKQRKSKNIYLCKGILKDPTGYTMTGILSGNVYKVVKNRLNGENYQFYAPLNLVDSVVWHIVKQYRSLTTPKEIKETIRKYNIEINTLQKKVTTLKSKVSEFEAQMLKINERIISGRIKEEVGDNMLDKINEQVRDCQLKAIEHQLEQQHLLELIQQIKNGETIDINKVTSYEEISDIIHSCIKEILVEKIIDKGIYELTITFVDNTEESVRINSYKKTAWYTLTGEHLQFTLFDRVRYSCKGNSKKAFLI